jgi:LmbE family N-acetylglucosaminyl deacetylase
VTHVFVGSHPDDIALSCGGLLASLRELGQAVTIISVFSGSEGGNGSGGDGGQSTTLGFGNKAVWPLTEAFRRDNIAPDFEVTPSVVTGRPPWMANPEDIELTQQRASTQARQFWQRAAWTRSANITNVASAERPLADAVAIQGSVEPVDFSKVDAMARRRIEEERYAYLMEASVVFLDLPEAAARGYSGDDQLLGNVRDDDIVPDQALYREIVRLEPQMVYFPLAVGNHVDHQLVRDAGFSLLAQGRRWVMPGPSFVGQLSFYEDFPYAWWNDYEGPLEGGRVNLDLPIGVGIEAGYADITDTLDRKAAGISLYASQITRLFDSQQGMLDDLAGYHKRVALAGGVSGYAERYWATTKL